jgi:hypothetical protein
MQVMRTLIGQWRDTVKAVAPHTARPHARLSVYRCHARHVTTPVEPRVTRFAAEPKGSAGVRLKIRSSVRLFASSARQGQQAALARVLPEVRRDGAQHARDKPEASAEALAPWLARSI